MADEVKGKIIRKCYIAKELLDSGNRIIDIKPDKYDPEKKRTVFVFEDTPKFQKDFEAIIERNKSSRSEFEDRVQKEVEQRLLSLSTITTGAQASCL